ncbi:hypothetical protein PMAYCL1PPCAC_26519, partial [Pristionchus mayeri]
QIVIVSEYGILTVSMNLLDLPGYVENLGTQLFSITFYAPFLLLTFNFIYRYRALVRPASNGSISRKMFASAFFIFIAYACLASVPSNLASMERDKNRRFFLNASPFTESYLSRDDSKPMTLPYFFVIPSLFYTLPFIVVLGMPFTGIDIGYSVNFIILAPTLYTVIDPIMIVLTVSRFRDVITGFYSRRDRRAKKNERNEMERSRAYQDIIRKRQISTVI